MTTERLYYTDSFVRAFDAQVLSGEAARPDSGASESSRWNVVLDRTAFYPTSGGQPHDTGRLGEALVLEVLEREEGAIVHITDRPLPPGVIRGEIDWERRFDHMQQHTGQHLLSAVFLGQLNYPTVSFHLGREISTIDLAAPGIEPEQLVEAEHRVNQLVFEDRGVNVRFGTAEELAAAGIRKAVEREGILRAIEIEGCDLQPCGGTHVARTGQIGLILLRKCEKARQNWRVEFVCGGRAGRAARGDFVMLGETARQLHCGLADVAAMVTRALEERQQSYRERLRLLEQVAQMEALLLLATEARPGKAGGPRIVLRVFQGAGPDYLRLLAGMLVAEPNVQALLGTRAGGHVVFAQSAGLSPDMNSLLRRALEESGGKGGGTRDFAQGSVPDAAALERVLKNVLDQLQGRAARP